MKTFESSTAFFEATNESDIQSLTCTDTKVSVPPKIFSKNF